jgi:hypothetical protein
MPRPIGFTHANTGRGDVVRLGQQHVSNGVITFRMEKNRGDGVVYPPLLPVLAATIAASKTGDLTFLVTERGTPFVKDSFGNWFRDPCREAGCPGSAHGLCKAGATRAAENGATVHQLMAAVRMEDRKNGADLHPKSRPQTPRLCSRAVALAADKMQNENRPHFESGAGVSKN